jgi:hypothetical protein
MRVLLVMPPPFENGRLGLENVSRSKRSLPIAGRPA